MSHGTSRRHFLERAAHVALGVAVGGMGAALPPAAQALDPFRRTPARRFPVSCAAYSFRQHLDLSKPTMTLEEFIVKCAEWGAGGVELTEYYFPKPVTSEYVSRLKRTAILWGLAVTGSPIGNRFTLPPGAERDREVGRVKDWIDVAADLGAPAIRIFAGNAPANVPEAEARKWVVECVEACCEKATRRGVFLALENHGGVVSGADGVLEIVRAVRCEWFGVNLDTGNFHGPDPYEEIARCAPYAVTCQLKVEISAAGGKPEPIDIARIGDILRKTAYRGYVTLEYEAREDPMAAVPRYLEQMRRLLG